MKSGIDQTAAATTLVSEQQLKEELPLPGPLTRQIDHQRKTLGQLLAGEDSRLLVIVGPCSVHDRESILDYARRLRELQARVENQLLLVMRVYIEKPRTCLGWKGMVNDPQRNGQTDINTGLQASRRLMLDIAELGLPIATEALNPQLVGYFDDLVSWYALGARTTESQTHREMASRLPGVLGFKNATDGGVEVAINAIKAAAQPQSITAINAQGRLVQEHSPGNAQGHLVMRGGKAGPNYDRASLLQASQQLAQAGLNPRVLVDASHANCGKVAERQVEVLQDLGQQLHQGSPLLGVMLESFIAGGNQPLQSQEGRYGQSMTDPCLDWAASSQALLSLAKEVKLATAITESA
jgi:3-deoxy-7-phosphoheptulonate synthase